jgi:hypothetical protein
MKLEEGDAFEVLNSQWLRERLPTYEPVWSAFIGHGGKGRACLMNGLTAEQEANRKRFYQAHYTLAVQARELEKILDSFSRSIGIVESPHAFLSAQRELFFVMALVGHIRDMLGIIDAALKMGGSLVGPAQEFYDVRSNVIHGPRVAAQVENGVLMIPRIAGRNAVIGEWHDKALWDEMEHAAFEPVPDFTDALRSDFFALINQLHPKIFAAADHYFEARRIEVPLAENTPLASGTFSGLESFSYDIPAQLSGVRDIGPL